MKLLAICVLLGMSLKCFSLNKEDQEEIASASEAAPAHITKEATFLTFEKGRLVKIKSGKNNFTCFVVREPKGRYEPSCLNEQAVRSILPAYELHMKSLYSGLSYDETYAVLDNAFKKGKLPTAETGSLVYMMSPYNKFYKHKEGKLISSPIHHLDERVFSLGNGPVFLWQGFPHLSALIVAFPSEAPLNKENHGMH